MRTESIEAVKAKMLTILSARGVSAEDASEIVTDFLAAQAEGKPTHGIGKFLLIDSALKARIGVPQIVRRDRCYALVDAQREIGQLAARFAVNLATDLARSSGIGLVGMTNASRYGRLKPYGRKLAEDGLIGLIANGGGPSAVVPFQGIDPILGTNPICIAFPSESGALVIDFSTAERTWGEIRQAVLEHRQLPADVFLDKDGRFTRNPDDAEGVLPFGGAKGFSLCLAIEILTGALVSAKMGLRVRDQYELGFLFAAIDPTIFVPLDQFRTEVEELLASITKSRPKLRGGIVRTPGHTTRTKAPSGDETIDLDDETWHLLSEMATGSGGGIASTKKVD